jgi:hypothetical protein
MIPAFPIQHLTRNTLEKEKTQPREQHLTLAGDGGGTWRGWWWAGMRMRVGSCKWAHTAAPVLVESYEVM